MAQAVYTVELESGRCVVLEASENASIELVKDKAFKRFQELVKDVIGMDSPKRINQNGWPKGKKRCHSS